MNREIILETLRRHREELRERFGVERLALFGSTARGEATDRSDVDLLVSFNRPAGFFHLSRTRRFIEEILGITNVDLVTFDGMKASIRERVLPEAIDA